MANAAFFEQLEQKINILLTSKKYQEAFDLCKDCLAKHPQEGRFLKLKEEIEQAVSDENEKIVMEKLDALRPLWKEKKYAEILRNLKDLLKIDPENSKLKDLYLEAETAYRKQFEKSQKEYNKQQNERLSELLKNNPEQLAEELFVLEKENPGNKNVRALTGEFRSKLILKKIKDKRALLDSEKYADIEHFLQELSRIDDTSTQVKELAQEIKNRKFQSSLIESKEFVYSGEKSLDTLMKLKKFDKVIRAANEILQVDKKNSYVRSILNTATAKYFTQLKNLAADAIIQNFPALKSEYLQDKSKFVKIW